uniref:Putative disease resistance protein-like protein n=1 Tax=Adineta vaga TaxID=104782 RepID=B3G4M2_ADIVA|nr:putative disease resistance protein-like protein [Adineta vaga]
MKMNSVAFIFQHLGTKFDLNQPTTSINEEMSEDKTGVYPHDITFNSRGISKICIVIKKFCFVFLCDKDEQIGQNQETFAVLLEEQQSNQENIPTQGSSITQSGDGSGENNQTVTTTTNISLNARKRIFDDGDVFIRNLLCLVDIKEWDEDEILGWFRSYKLNRLYNTVIATHETQKDGAMLAKIFDCKVKNYDRYRHTYGGRLPKNDKNLFQDFHRFGELLDSFFIDKLNHRFDVAFSFPGDIRERVKKIAEKLCQIINRDGEQRVFYDKYYKAELARPNLDLYLHNIYRYQSRLIVLFMCQDYSRKEWCGLEARAIRSLRKTYQNERIMLLSVDGTTIDDIPDIDGYWDISEEDDDTVVQGIYERLQALGDSQISIQTQNLPRIENLFEKIIRLFKEFPRTISSWYIVVAIVAYILGTFIGR